MAINQVNPVQPQQKKSALETFANITGIGMNLAGMFDKVSDLTKPKVANSLVPVTGAKK